jgi:hypothetical protein
VEGDVDAVAGDSEVQVLDGDGDDLPGVGGADAEPLAGDHDDPSLGTLRWTLTSPGAGEGSGASAIRAPRSPARLPAATGDGRVLARMPPSMTWMRYPRAGARPGRRPRGSRTAHPQLGEVLGAHAGRHGLDQLQTAASLAFRS